MMFFDAITSTHNQGDVPGSSCNFYFKTETGETFYVGVYLQEKIPAPEVAQRLRELADQIEEALS